MRAGEKAIEYLADRGKGIKPKQVSCHGSKPRIAHREPISENPHTGVEDPSEQRRLPNLQRLLFVSKWVEPQELPGAIKPPDNPPSPDSPPDNPA